MNKRVYSSDGGRMCPDCGRPAGDCVCAKNRNAAPADGVVRVSRETKGRKGKGVTLVTGVPLEGAELADLGKLLEDPLRRRRYGEKRGHRNPGRPPRQGGRRTGRPGLDGQEGRRLVHLPHPEQFEDIDQIIGHRHVRFQLRRLHVRLPLFLRFPVLEKQEVARILAVAVQVVLQATVLDEGGGDQLDQLGGQGVLAAGLGLDARDDGQRSGHGVDSF